MATFDLEQYSTVQERIAQFYQDFPDGSIRTFMVVRDGPEVVFEARVYRNPEEAAMGVYTSGWAREIEGKSPVNKTAHLENCESSAVGRALSNLGYATDARRPSRSEMLKTARQREEHEALLQEIREKGPKVPDGLVFEIAGEDMGDLKEYVRKNWPAIKERHRVAILVVEAMDRAIAAASDTAEAGANQRARSGRGGTSTKRQAKTKIERLSDRYFALLGERFPGLDDADRHAWQEEVIGKESSRDWTEAEFEKAISMIEAGENVRFLEPSPI